MAAIPLVDRDVHVTEALIRVMEQAGIDTVFGMSGGNTGRIFSQLAFHTDTIRTVLVRNEAHATSAAEAYARESGKLAIAMAQGSWLLGQGIVGTLEALLTGTPMILIGDLSDGAPYSQHAPYQSGNAEWGAWDARLAFSGITKLVLESHSPVQAVQHLQLAVKHALSGQPGPVALLLHSDALLGEVGPASEPPLYATSGYLARPEGTPPSTEAAAVVAALRSASAPVLLAGGGVRMGRAEAELRAVAEASGATVVTTASGKGTFAEDHPLAAGVFGNFGTPRANDLLAAADLVVVLGSKLGPSDTASGTPDLISPARQQVIQVDVEPRNAGWTMPIESVVIADVKALLGEIQAQLRAEPIAADTIAARTKHAVDAPAGEEYLSGSDAVPIPPQRAIAELRAALPDDVVICADAGENRLLMCRYFQSRTGGSYIQPAGAGGMGYAIPAALGVKVAEPDRAVVAVCGDGGFSMALPALLSAVEENLPIVVVVFNNGILGWVKHSQRSRGEQEFKSTLLGFDYAGIGGAIGLKSAHVEKPDDIRPAVEAALAARVPALVVVDVSTEQTFVDLRTPLLG
jgi:acetolactate synthase-1/2/3 large subunit